MPLWGVLAAAVWLDEALSWRLLVAAGLLVGGYLLNYRGTLRARRKVMPPGLEAEPKEGKG